MLQYMGLQRVGHNVVTEKQYSSSSRCSVKMFNWDLNLILNASVSVDIYDNNFPVRTALIHPISFGMLYFHFC